MSKLSSQQLTPDQRSGPIASLVATSLVAMSVLAAPLHSAEQDNLAEIEINGCAFTEQSSTLTFSGCFELRQGSRTINSSQATINRAQDNQFRQIKLAGQPATWNELDDAGQPFSARAEQIDYDVQQQVITLRGTVEVNQSDREISGQMIRYDLRSGRIDASGNPDDPNSKIRMRFPAPTTTPPTTTPEDIDTSADQPSQSQY